MIRTAIAVSVLIVLAGCQYDPWAHNFLTGHAEDKDVAGTYVLDAESQKREIRIGLKRTVLPINRSARVVLSRDHRAQFIAVPEDYDGGPCSITGRGSWRIAKHGGFTLVEALITNDDPCGPYKRVPFGYQLRLYGRRPPYKLHVTISDPDLGDAVQFEKVR